jgi:hypothetical protein
LNREISLRMSLLAWQIEGSRLVLILKTPNV